MEQAGHGSRNRNVRHGQQHPNDVHWHNQHTHGTSEGFGGFSLACCVEPCHKIEEAQCKQTDQQEQVSPEDVPHYAPTSTLNQIHVSQSVNVSLWKVERSDWQWKETPPNQLHRVAEFLPAAFRLSVFDV